MLYFRRLSNIREKNGSGKEKAKKQAGLLLGIFSFKPVRCMGRHEERIFLPLATTPEEASPAFPSLELLVKKEKERERLQQPFAFPLFVRGETKCKREARPQG